MWHQPSSSNFGIKHDTLRPQGTSENLVRALDCNKGDRGRASRNGSSSSTPGPCPPYQTLSQSTRLLKNLWQNQSTQAAAAVVHPSAWHAVALLHSSRCKALPCQLHLQLPALPSMPVAADPLRHKQDEVVNPKLLVPWQDRGADRRLPVAVAIISAGKSKVMAADSRKTNTMQMLKQSNSHPCELAFTSISAFMLFS